MFGCHMSIAGGLENALFEAESLGMGCLQVFTKNQRQWLAPKLTDEQVARWKQVQQDTGLTRVVSHDSYLINLASPKKDVRRKSIELYREELTRCERLDIPHLVMHPGAHLGEGEEQGIVAIAEAFNQLHQQLPDLAVITCLEITAGQGTTLGYTFEQLAAIIEQVEQPQRMGVCLDTAHLLGAGYDLTSAAGAKSVLKQCDKVIGLDRVHVLHLNDSKVPLGSRKDRHEHIGHGYVSLDAFEVVVNTAKLKHATRILETPKAESPDGRPWDVVNIETLQSLCHTRGKSGGARQSGV